LSPLARAILLVLLVVELVASVTLASFGFLLGLGAAEKKETSVTCDVNPRSVHLGLSVTVWGGLYPYLVVPVTLTFIRPDGTPFQRSTWTFMGSWGVAPYNYTFTPDMEGVWRVYASWPGNDEYYGATSEVVNFTVLPPITMTKIYLTLPKSEVTVGDSLEVSGKLVAIINGSEVPIGGVPIIVWFFPPVGWDISQTAYTEDDGTFSLAYKPPLVGNWTISVSWGGNETHTRCSASQTFTVLEKRFPWAEVVGGSVVAVVVIILGVKVFRRKRH